MPEAHLVFGAFRLDPENACLWHQGERIPLPPKAYQTLRYLAEYPARLVTKNELLNAVWPNTCVTDATLKVCIAELRKRLADRPRQPQYIETVHRRGYRFLPSVTPIWQPLPSGQSTPTPAMTTMGIKGHQALVGRSAQLAALERHLRTALRGERQIVFVTGEPGIGKTALVEVFLEQIAATMPQVLVARGQCVRICSKHEAYLPLLEALAALCQGPQMKQLIPLLQRYAPTWLARMPWLMDTPQRGELQHHGFAAARERMLREMVEALWRLAGEAPFVLLLEDLHWSDGATVDLLASLAQRRGLAQLLVIGTYRPVELLHQHPLKAIKQTLALKELCTELALPFLTELEVHSYLGVRFQGNRFPANVAKALHERTDGNPLFLMSVLLLLIQDGSIRDIDGAWRFVGNCPDIASTVPENIREMLEEHIEELPTLPRTVLEAASVAGVDFSSALVAAVLGRAVVDIEACCQALAQRGQFLERGIVTKWPDGSVAQRYRFIHALYQQVLYQRLPGGRRAELHRDIGFSLERGYQQRASRIAAALANHFEHAREFARAIQYLRQAAADAASRYANSEAMSYLDRALHWAQQLAEPERSTALMSIRSERAALPIVDVARIPSITRVEPTLGAETSPVESALLQPKGSPV